MDLVCRANRPPECRRTSDPVQFRAAKARHHHWTAQDDVEIDIDEAWQVLVQEYPDLDKIYGEFRLMSLALANSFRLTVVEAKDPSSYADIAKKLEKQFLSKYFGRYVAVQDLAKRLLLRGRNTAARRLNKEAKAASNMTSQEREQFVRRF